jgi:hypothetical protein
LVKGKWRLDFAFQFHPLKQLVHGSDYVSFSKLKDISPEAAEHGNADFYVQQADLVPRYALSETTEIFFALPYKRFTLRVDNEDEHHRDETLVGPGDIRLAAKHYFLNSKSLQFAGTFGLSTPTGQLNRVTAGSYLDHDEATALGVTVPKHSHLQLGTGTFDPILGLEALYRFNDRWLFWSNLNTQVPLYSNRYGYRTSASFSLSAGPAVRLAESKVIGGFFGEAFYAGRDQFRGADVIGPGGVFNGNFGVPNTGRLEVAIRPTLTWAASDQLTVTLQARIPIYTRIREDATSGDVQLTEPAGIFLGFSHSF